jgi:hypothetical protein
MYSELFRKLLSSPSLLQKLLTHRTQAERERSAGFQWLDRRHLLLHIDIVRLGYMKEMCCHVSLMGVVAL